MNWLVLWYTLQVGISPNSMIVDYPKEAQTFYPLTGYVQMEAELRAWNLLFVGGLIRAEIQKEELPNWTFRPEMMSYGFKAGMRKGGLEVGMLYVCQHPVLPYYSYYKPVINWEGWYAEVYLRFSGEARL